MTAVTFTRTVRADVATAFACWAEPDRFRIWWWPQWPGTSYDLDVREGGRYRIAAPFDGVGVSGSYTEIRPHALLGFTWQWDDETEVDRVVVLFTGVDAATTEVTVVHIAPGRDVGDGFIQGWGDVLDRLASMPA